MGKLHLYFFTKCSPRVLSWQCDLTGTASDLRVQVLLLSEGCSTGNHKTEINVPFKRYFLAKREYGIYKSNLGEIKYYIQYVK